MTILGEQVIHACRIGDVSTVKALIKSEKVSVNYKCQQNGSTPLMHAAQCDRLEILKFLMKNGADIKLSNGLRTVWGYTSKGSRIYNYIKNYEKNYEKKELPRETQINEDLIECCESGIYHGVVALVNFGKTDINYPCLENKSTPLMCASKKGHLKIVKFLVEHGAETDGKASELAIDNKHYDIIEYLFKKKFENEKMWSCDVIRVQKNKVNLLKELLYRIDNFTHL